jgi:hypothetical protein
MKIGDFIYSIYGLPGGAIFPPRAAAEAERTAAPRPVESGYQTPVESGKEQGT